MNPLLFGIKRFFLGSINFYQKYLSIFSHGSCRYYPTCSQYGKIQFLYTNPFIAFFYTSIRILRCNKLFKGGIEYPIVRHRIDKVVFKKIKIKFWLVPNGDGRFYVIPNWERNRKN